MYKTLYELHSEMSIFILVHSRCNYVCMYIVAYIERMCCVSGIVLGLKVEKNKNKKKPNAIGEIEM